MQITAKSLSLTPNAPLSSRLFSLWRTTWSAVCLAAAALVSTAVLADPPARAGRVGYIEGDVSFYADRTEGWQKARINFPVSSENSVWTENQSRAEVRIGASSVRLGENSILDFLSINDDQTNAFLQRGILNIRTRTDNYSRNDKRTDRESFSIETSEGRFIMEGNGRFHIDAAQDGAESRISVFGGRARYESTNSASGIDNRLTVESGKTLIVRNASTGNPPGGISDAKNAIDFRFERANESEFDRWASARDQRWDETHTRMVREQTISPYMTGYEDLDANGDWIEDREYGRIWTPRAVAVGWAPYRYGSWAYVRPWGWTWVDDAAWGFAPFHYGRWVYAGTRWGWWPGPYARRPIYAPALVGWYGRPGINISISTGPSIGWFPLAPREHFIPSYTTNVTYIRNINHVTNNITVINPPTRYANQMPGATFVNGQTFVNARPVQNNVIKVTAKELAEHPIMATPSAMPFPKDMGSRTLGAQNNAPSLPVQQPAQKPAQLPQNNGTGKPKYAGKPAPEPVFSGAQPNNNAVPATAMPAEMTSRTSPQSSPQPSLQPSPQPSPQRSPQLLHSKPTPSAPEAIERLPNAAASAPIPTYQNRQHGQREGRVIQPATEGLQQGHNPAQTAVGRVEHIERAERAEKPVRPRHEKVEKIEHLEKPEKREPEPRGKLENR